MTPPERLLESLSVISNGCGGAVQKTGDASLLYLGVFCECEMTTTRPYLQGDPRAVSRACFTNSTVQCGYSGCCTGHGTMGRTGRTGKCGPFGLFLHFLCVHSVMKIVLCYLEDESEDFSSRWEYLLSPIQF